MITHAITLIRISATASARTTTSVVEEPEDSEVVAVFAVVVVVEFGVAFGEFAQGVAATEFRCERAGRRRRQPEGEHEQQDREGSQGARGGCRQARHAASIPSEVRSGEVCGGRVPRLQTVECRHMAPKQRQVRMEQRGAFEAIQALETRSDEELEAETKYKAAAMAILGRARVRAL